MEGSSLLKGDEYCQVLAGFLKAHDGHVVNAANAYLDFREKRKEAVIDLLSSDDEVATTKTAEPSLPSAPSAPSAPPPPVESAIIPEKDAAMQGNIDDMQKHIDDLTRKNQQLERRKAHLQEDYEVLKRNNTILEEKNDVLSQKIDKQCRELREVVKEREVMKKKDVQVVIPVPSRDFRDMLRDDEEPMLLDAVFFPVRIDRPATERMNDVALPQEPNLEADIVEQRQFIHGLVAAVEETHDAFEARTMALVHEIEASDRELDRLEGVHTDMLAQNNQCEEYTTVMSEKIREYKKKIENEKLLLREQVEFASKDFGYDAGVAFVDYRKAREEPYARLKQRQDELGRNNDEHKENSRVLERECTEFEEKSLEESRNNAEKMRVLLGQLKALFQDQEALQARVTRQCRVNQDRRCTASEANKKSVQAHKQLTHLVVVHEHQNVVIDEADKRVANYVEEKRSKTRNDVDNTQNALAADKEKCDALCAKTLHLLKEKQAQQQRALRRLERKMANTMEEWQNLRTENAPEQEIRAAKDIVDQLTRQMAHVRQDIGRTETHIAAAALDTPPTSPPEVTIHDSIFARAFSRPFEWFRSTASVDQSMDSNDGPAAKRPRRNSA